MARLSHRHHLFGLYLIYLRAGLADRIDFESSRAAVANSRRGSHVASGFRSPRPRGQAATRGHHGQKRNTGPTCDRPHWFDDPAPKHAAFPISSLICPSNTQPLFDCVGGSGVEVFLTARACRSATWWEPPWLYAAMRTLSSNDPTSRRPLPVPRPRELLEYARKRRRDGRAHGHPSRGSFGGRASADLSGGICTGRDQAGRGAAMERRSQLSRRRTPTFWRAERLLRSGDSTRRHGPRSNGIEVSYLSWGKPPGGGREIE